MSDGVEGRLLVVEYKVEELHTTIPARLTAIECKLDELVMQRARWDVVFGGVSKVLWIAIGALVPIAIAAAASGAAAIMRAAPASAP